PDLVRQQWCENELAAQILSWHEEEGMSLRAIVQRLNAAKIPTRSGRGQWYQPSVSELLRHRLPKGKQDRKDFIAKYGPSRHAADDATPPQPQRRRTRKAAAMGSQVAL